MAECVPTTRVAVTRFRQGLVGVSVQPLIRRRAAVPWSGQRFDAEQVAGAMTIAPVENYTAG
jgi:hypothetical protein